MILGIAIYLIGFFLVLWIFYRDAHSFYKENGVLQITRGEIAYCLVMCLLSWIGALGILCLWLIDHSDDVVINLEKKTKND